MVSFGSLVFGLVGFGLRGFQTGRGLSHGLSFDRIRFLFGGSRSLVIQASRRSSCIPIGVPWVLSIRSSKGHLLASAIRSEWGAIEEIINHDVAVAQNWHPKWQLETKAKTCVTPGLSF